VDSRTFAILVALGATLLNGVWLFIDRSTPSWDQSSYLSLALTYNSAAGDGGVGGLVRTVFQADPARGPLFAVLISPFLALFGDAGRSATLLHLLLAPALYLGAGEIAMTIFRNWRARLLAIGLTAFTPLMVGLFHNVLVDFTLVTLTTLSIAFLLKSDLFARRGMTVAMAVAMGLGTLTKVTFPAFVAGPVLVAAVQLLLLTRSASRPEGQLGRRLGNLALGLLVYAVLTLTWYLPHLQQTLDYVRSTTSGPLSLGAGPSNPLTLPAISAYTLNVFNNNLSWILVLAGLVARVANLGRLSTALRAKGAGADRAHAATLLTWVLVPYVAQVTSRNQDIRLLAPALVGFVVATAGGLSVIPRSRLRLSVAVVALGALLFTTVNRIVPVGPSFLPQEVRLTLGGQTAWLPIASSATVGYEQLPQRDRTTRVFRYLESLAAERAADGAQQPETVCMLQSLPVTNTNTYSFLARAREDAFVVQDVVVGEGGTAALAATLATCDFALFVKPQEVHGADAVSRVTLVNDPFAANYMTPPLLKTFDGPRRAFPIGARPVLDDESTPPDDSRVVVLSKRVS
jgi:4-amino-4-deoxy-L-arabinose transferase-like glycosyltransferase